MNARAEFPEFDASVDDHGSPLTTLRVPPYSLEAEQGVLGGLMLNNRMYDLVGDMLTPADFYRPLHQAVFSAISTQMLAGKPVDPVTVWEMVKDSPDLARVELADIHELAQYVPSAPTARRYAEIIRDRALSRRLIAAAAEISDLGFDTSLGFEPRLEAATAKLAGLVQEAPRDEWVGAAEGMVAHTQTLEARSEGRIAAWETGLDDLDQVLEGGLVPGSLYVVGARPSMGKSAFGMSVGLHMAREMPVGMLSMEMSMTDLNDRITAMVGRVALPTVKRPQKGLAWDRVIEGCERAKKLRWFASEQPSLTIGQVRLKARQLQRTVGLKVLVVDYIGLMAGSDPKAPRAYQLEEISRGLKSLAKELEIAVICLAQLNRKVDERGDKPPTLSDLRDSGAIEQDADVVMFLHRPVQTNPDLGGDWLHYAKLHVAKNRQGRSGVVVNLMYLGEQTRFANWSGPAPIVKVVSNNSRGMRDE